jgi:K+-transporting ATPase KdpF subunit
MAPAALLPPGYRFCAFRAANPYKIFISFPISPSRTLMRFGSILMVEIFARSSPRRKEQKGASLRCPRSFSAFNKNNKGITIDDGHYSYRDRSFVFYPVHRLHQSLRQPLVGETPMLLDYLLGGGVTIFLTAYLIYALIRPERF